MSGIAGVVYPDVFQITHIISPMLKCLKHRGEDAYGSHVFKNMEIGTCGRPMGCNEKKTVYCGLSGYLDNAEEVAKELQRNGYQCPTGTHEEVIVHAYELWGIPFLNKIKGSFALVILDRMQEQLILARDTTGKKPLYWYQDQHHFLFASELKSLLATGIVPQTPAADALAAYLYFGYTPQDMTPIQGVCKLLPAHYLQFTRNQSKHIESYWSYSSFFEEKAVAHRPTIIKTIDQMLSSSMKQHIIPEKPLSCFVSGGLGSSSVAYYLNQEAAQDQVAAFSVAFEGENEEDLAIASEVTGELKMPHEKKLLTPENFLQDFTKIIWYLDEPLADPNIIATWELAKAASEHSNVVFSGMGSDELFAGHARYTVEEGQRTFMGDIKELSSPFFSHWLAPLMSYFYKPAAYSLLKTASSKEWQIDYLNRNALFNKDELDEVSPKLSHLFDPNVFLHKFHNISRIKSSTSAFLYFDVKTRLADLYMQQYEKLTAAHNLVWYSPFLDRDLLEYAASLPEPSALSEGDAGAYLRKILENHLPRSVLSRPKRSRHNFLNSWLEISELPTLFLKLRTGVLIESGIISEEWLDTQLESMQQQKDSFRYLWGIFTLEVWFRLFINRPIQETPPEIDLKELLSER